MVAKKLKRIGLVLGATLGLAACGAGQMYEAFQSGDWQVMFSNFGVEVSQRWEKEYVGGFRGAMLGNSFEGSSSSAQPRSYYQVISRLQNEESKSFEVTVSYFCGASGDFYKDSFIVTQEQLGSVIERPLRSQDCRPRPDEVLVEIRD